MLPERTPEYKQGTPPAGGRIAAAPTGARWPVEYFDRADPNLWGPIACNVEAMLQ